MHVTNGIVKTDKKIYCDLLFDQYDEQVVSWFENLQILFKNLFMKKRMFGLTEK